MGYNISQIHHKISKKTFVTKISNFLKYPVYQREFETIKNFVCIPKKMEISALPL